MTLGGWPVCCVSPFTSMLKEILDELEKLEDSATASILQKFFKTGPGDYGEGDRFRGIRVPVLRKFAKKYQKLELSDNLSLLRSPFHEDRLLALLILIRVFCRSDPATREQVYELYLGNTHFINNWDLVDLSAEHIVGAFLRDKERDPLYRLARSTSLWERRIAVLATFNYVKCGQFEETFRIAEMLLRDKEDLLHKAVGWMLRETGKRDLGAEQAFLNIHYQQMPRTMLRYAIERFPEDKRLEYLRRPRRLSENC